MFTTEVWQHVAFLPTETPSAPLQPRGSGTFRIATWNIVDGRRGLAAAAKGMDQMGVGNTLLTKTKIVNKRYTQSTSGYQVRCSKAVSGHLGGSALI